VVLDRISEQLALNTARDKNAAAKTANLR
jgi:hypothetical protein